MDSNKNNKPIMRSSDMKPEIKKIVMDIVQEQMIQISDIASKMTQFKKQFSEQFNQDYCSATWNVAIGNNYSISTQGKKGWYAHIYLKGTFSIVIWRTA